MDRFARIVIGYHGCTQAFARELLQGKTAIADWRFSRNAWDWLGRGIYFWEHSPSRALRWAQQQRSRSKTRPSVIGAVLQLGRCFDLFNESITGILASSYNELMRGFAAEGRTMPTNQGRESKLRKLDCLDRLEEEGITYDTVRCAFWEGEPLYPGAGFARETHIQIAVRNPACILGVFQPNLNL